MVKLEIGDFVVWNQPCYKLGMVQSIDEGGLFEILKIGLTDEYKNWHGQYFLAYYTVGNVDKEYLPREELSVYENLDGFRKDLSSNYRVRIEDAKLASKRRYVLKKFYKQKLITEMEDIFSFSREVVLMHHFHKKSFYEVLAQRLLLDNSHITDYIEQHIKDQTKSGQQSTQRSKS